MKLNHHPVFALLSSAICYQMLSGQRGDPERHSFGSPGMSKKMLAKEKLNEPFSSTRALINCTTVVLAVADTDTIPVKLLIPLLFCS